MPTQEERIETLERNQSTIVRGISDLNHHVTMVEGILTRQEIDIRDIKNGVRTLNDRLSVFEQSVNNRLETIASRFEVINSRFDAQDSRFNDIDNRFNNIDNKFNDIDNRFNDMDKRFESVDKRLDSLDQKFDQVLLILSQLTEKQG